METPQTGKLEAFLTLRPSQSTRRHYRDVVLGLMESSLGPPPTGGAWEPAALTAAYETRLAAAADPRAQAVADLRRRVGELLATLGGRTVQFHYIVSKAWLEELVRGDLPRWELKETRRAIRNRTPPARVKPALSKEQLCNILSFAALEERAFFLVMKSSGARPDEVAKLRWSQVDRSRSPWRLTLGSDSLDPEAQTKEGGSRISFVDSETEPPLRFLLDHPLEGPADQRVFAGMGETPRASCSHARAVWRWCVKRAKYRYSDDRGRPVLKMYLLRSFFRRNAGSKEGVGRDVAEILMGHHLEATERAYANFSEDELRERYRDGEQALWCSDLWRLKQGEAAAPGKGA